jgi:hypothetical protein
MTFCPSIVKALHRLVASILLARPDRGRRDAVGASVDDRSAVVIEPHRGGALSSVSV